MLTKETKDYINDTLLPSSMTGYDTGKSIAKDIIEYLENGVNCNFYDPKNLAKNILKNKKEFINYTIKSFNVFVEDNNND